MSEENILETALKNLPDFTKVLTQGEDSTPLLVAPNGYQLHNLERFLPLPIRVRGDTAFTDVGSFLAYYDRFAEGSTPLITAKREGAQFVLNCTLDYDKDATNPRWCEHEASLKLQFKPEFARWMISDRKPFSQEEFADFIEDYIALFVEPDGATMLEMVQELQGIRKVEWTKGKRLNNGQVSLEWMESLEAKGKTGAMVVPTQFKVSMQIFEHVPPSNFIVNLRWRMSEEKKLSFSYKIMNLPQLLDAAILDVTSKVETHTKVPVLNIV